MPGELKFEILVLEMLVSELLLLLEVLISIVLVPGVLVVLMWSRTWEYTHNDLESWD